jgi:Icc-related predicted phosphoesterase
MKLALFSDVHGHLRLVLHLLRCWQMSHQTELDGALIAGDLGCFPDPTKFDKATKRWLERDPEEAGFSRFFTRPVPQIKAMLDGESGPYSAIRCPILFVAGNHEDHAYLASVATRSGVSALVEETFPVDCYQAFHCIRDGRIVTLQGRDGVAIKIAGLWGIENARPEAPYRIQEKAVRNLIRQGEGNFDLLLTHDAPVGVIPKGGSPQVTDVIRRCQPKVHVFGHIHAGKRHEFCHSGAATRSWIFKDVSFGPTGNDRLENSMGILHWNGRRLDVEIVQELWLQKMQKHNWLQVLPPYQVKA